MNLARRAALLEAYTPLRPMAADVFELFGFEPVPLGLAIILRDLRLEILAKLLMMRSKRRQTAAHVRQSFDRSLNANHCGSIKLYLLANVPIERTSDEALQRLRDGILEAGRPRVYSADRCDLRLGSVARVNQRHQIRSFHSIQAE